MTKHTKEDILNIVKKFEEEPRMFFTVQDMTNEIGFVNASLVRRMRDILDEMVDSKELTKHSIGSVVVYSIAKNHRVRLPFFDHPLKPTDAQIFIDKFWDDISSFVSNLVESNSFSLEINDNNVYAKKIERRRL